MTGTMIAGVHDDESLRKTVCSAPVFPTLLVIVNPIVVGPGRQYRYQFGPHPLCHDAALHKMVQRDNAVSVIKARLQQCPEYFCRKRVLLEPAGGDCLVGIEVHDPEEKLSTFETNEK